MEKLQETSDRVQITYTCCMQVDLDKTEDITALRHLYLGSVQYRVPTC